MKVRDEKEYVRGALIRFQPLNTFENLLAAMEPDVRAGFQEAVQAY